MAAIRKPGSGELNVARDPRWGDAAGLARVRPGFCSSPDYDALFALGWPHIRFVMEGHREDEDPPASALRILAMADPPLRFAWPRTVAQGVVRAWGLPSIFELAPGFQELRQEAEEAVWKPGPITPGEAYDLLACRLNQEIPGVSDRGIESFVLLLEALVGADVVGSAMLDILEQIPVDTLLSEWSIPPHVTFQLGFLMLRVPRPQHDAWVGRMEALLEGCFAARPALRRHGFRGAGASHARSLHLVLNGGAAAENSSDRSLRWYVHVVNDSVLVRMRVAVNRLGYEPDARLVFLGGPDVLERYARDWPKLASTDAQRWFFEQVAPIAAPQMYPLMLEMTGRSLVRPEAIGWFVKNAEAARVFLEETCAGDGIAATYARTVRKALGAAA
ncbi:MAG: hypothetical protein Q8P18_28910 [Pseudomonadota bacterium]|nr:hypothetical protein [Pseudomonadota bacterium]